jgi:hypothetical protein
MITIRVYKTISIYQLRCPCCNKIYIEDRLVDPFITDFTNILGTANITTGNQNLPSIYEIIIIP